MKIAGVEFRRGFFNVNMFPHLRVVSRIFASIERTKTGIGIRRCMQCKSWQPYIDHELKDKYLSSALLLEIQRKVPALKDISNRASDGYCPPCYRTHMRKLGVEVLSDGTEIEWGEL